MRIYNYVDGEVVDITDQQYDFLHILVRHNGRMDSAIKECPIPDEQLKLWQEDKVFWPVLTGYIEVVSRARGLTADYVKDFLLGVLSGRREPTEAQLKIVNQAVRALGMGLQSRTASKVEITPSNTTITFNDGTDV